ncbi:phosphodiester glycosidase family protein [Novosphingobium sp. 1949]|uniref:Phosphodiester glycosidase family protein n=1 Tax=Novosphingobium organovorum TaxID=2930092 RepID=A0ABT0B7S4_9SPHN|nr:phosphodiester glycosidase family protein [Novosphingobium organovorum]MCJ2181116.1 phosphodiester glycosidase family protein [Novosphingobium organovorum]
MRRARLFPAAAPLLFLAACSSSPEAEADAPPPPACETARFDSASFTHCLAVPGRHAIHLVIGPKGGKPYRTMSELAVGRAAGSAPVAFAMNAGMFDQAGYPIGYYVSEGVRRHPLNTNTGPGNFHLLPNGVFFGSTDGHWRVMTSEQFAAGVSHRPDFGTQSGPMLVIDGQLHPDIDPRGTSKKMRNGVGVDRAGQAHFVISEEPVSFGTLARYFRDALHCPNALYLDGSVSSLWDPEHGRVDGGPELGPLIVVEKRAKATTRVAAPRKEVP